MILLILVYQERSLFFEKWIMTLFAVESLTMIDKLKLHLQKWASKPNY